MHERLILQHSQNGRSTDAVVGTQGRTIGRHPLAIDVGLDRVGQEVKLLVVVLLGHHIQVGLNHHTHAVLHTLRGSLTHIDVVAFILLPLQPLGLREVDDVLTNRLLVTRRTGNLGHGGKMFPNQSGFERG